MTEIGKWLRVKDAAEIMSMTNRTVHKMIKAGVIPAKKIGRNWKIPEAGLREYLERQE